MEISKDSAERIRAVAASIVIGYICVVDILNVMKNETYLTPYRLTQKDSETAENKK